MKALVVAGLTAVLLGQSQPPFDPAQGKPTFRAGVELVQVDVVVVDKTAIPSRD